ncbi:hypothetical protein [Argonema antarcticum]|uniref:hypothetical protein n=1 Tax=Argonema antarcticum TaxID=2942763 RepID=UPI002010F1A5|nr:hypothetical protein [Argonema antarcticum]MCL1472631.1 hypothetical protein [Argonema antarcticum A004/B2]
MTNTNSTQTNSRFGQMLKKTYILGILTATTLGVLPLAAQATPKPCCQSSSAGDSAVVQTSNQQANVKGKGNAVVQNSNQSVNTASNTRVRPTSSNQKRPTHARRTVRRPAAAPCKTISNVK